MHFAEARGERENLYAAPVAGRSSRVAPARPTGRGAGQISGSGMGSCRPGAIRLVRSGAGRRAGLVEADPFDRLHGDPSRRRGGGMGRHGQTHRACVGAQEPAQRPDRHRGRRTQDFPGQHAGPARHRRQCARTHRRRKAGDGADAAGGAVGRLSCGALRDAGHGQGAAGARQPRARHVLVLQQLGLQHARHDLRTGDGNRHLRGAGPADRQADRHAGLPAAGRRLCPGRRLDPSCLPAAHERARPRALRPAVPEQGRLGGKADRAGRLGRAKARVPIRSNSVPGSATAICGGPRRPGRSRVGFPRGPSSPGAPAASTPSSFPPTIS